MDSSLPYHKIELTNWKLWIAQLGRPPIEMASPSYSHSNNNSTRHNAVFQYNTNAGGIPVTGVTSAASVSGGSISSQNSGAASLYLGNTNTTGISPSRGREYTYAEHKKMLEGLNFF